MNLSAFLGELFKRKPLLVSASAGVIATFFAAGYMHRFEQELLQIAEPRPTAIAASDIAAGDAVDAEDVRMGEIAMRFQEPGVFGTREEVDGRIAAAPLKAGAQVTRWNTRSAADGAGVAGLLPQGSRAIAILLDEATSRERLIRPGDRVDLFGTFEIGGSGSPSRATTLLVEDLSVIAVEGSSLVVVGPRERSSRQRNGGEGAARSPFFATAADSVVSFPAATLAVTPEQAQLIAFARTAGTLQVVLRAFGDDLKATPVSPTTIGTITGNPEDRLQKRRWPEGRSVR